MNAADRQRIEGNPGGRAHRVEVIRGTSVGDVFVRGQRPARRVRRERLLNAVARVIGLPMLVGDARLFGPHAQQVEVARLRALAAADVAVPTMLHEGADDIALQFVPGPQLTERLRGGQTALWWRRGLEGIADLRRRGRYLSQAFARHFIADDDWRVAIDFEADPAAFMPLDTARPLPGPLFAK